jgi:hypothetical protein
MSNKLNGLSLDETNLLIDSLEEYKDNILDTTLSYEKHPDYENINYLLSQLYSIMKYLEATK